MPRYYFHLRHDQLALIDCEGLVLADAAAAREQATRSIRDFFCPSLGTVDPDWVGWRLDLRDQCGCRVLDIAFDDAPAINVGLCAQEAVQPPAAAVIFLSVERKRRELAAAEDHTRALLRRTHVLMAQHRNRRQHLAEQLDRTKQLRSSSLALVARARQQSCANWTDFKEAIVA